MGVYVKGMEMPTYDGVFPCRLRVENGVAKLEIDYIITAFMDERKVYPLIEIPPHGRLIDADALTTVTEMVNGEFKTYIELFEIADAPTIIESEGEDG